MFKSEERSHSVMACKRKRRRFIGCQDEMYESQQSLGTIEWRVHTASNKWRNSQVARFPMEFLSTLGRMINDWTHLTSDPSRFNIHQAKGTVAALLGVARVLVRSRDLFISHFFPTPLSLLFLTALSLRFLYTSPLSKSFSPSRHWFMVFRRFVTTNISFVTSRWRSITSMEYQISKVIKKKVANVDFWKILYTILSPFY